MIARWTRYRWLVVALLVGCRFNFEPLDDSSRGQPRDSSISDVSSGDATSVTGDGVVAGCGYVQCEPGFEACCVADMTSCVAVGACQGGVFSCGPGTCGTDGFCCTCPYGSSCSSGICLDC